MKITKKIICVILVVVLLLAMLPATTMAAEGEYVYLSVSFDKSYITDRNGDAIVYRPVPLDKIAAVDLAEYGLENMLYDGDGDGEYDITALQLLIYAHEEIYGGTWGEVNFDAMPGSSYFKGGIFGFTENLVYFLNGDFPVDDSQQSDFMTVGATSDRIVLKDGDFLDVASFTCYSFLWDMLGGFHLFADQDGNYVHEYTAKVGEALPVKLMHSFCDLMYGEAWVVDATDYEVYYGTNFGEAEGSVITDESGNAEITFSEAGMYFVWCEGGTGSDDGTHSACDYYFECGEPCPVSSPAYAKVVVENEEQTAPVLDENISIGEQLYLENDLAMHFRIRESFLSGYDISTAYLIVERDVYATDGSCFVDVQTLTDYTVSDGRVIFAYSGIAAAQMNDEIRVTLYIKDAQGKEYMSPQKVTSVTAYAKSLLEAMPIGYPRLYTVLMDMLNYGTATQVYFGRHKDAPANKAYEIFADYAHYASGDLSAPLEKTDSILENEGATGKLNVTLDLGTRVGITYKVTLSNAENAVLVIRDAQGKELERIDVAGNPTDDRGRYILNFYGSTSRDMRRVVYATAYANGKAVTDTYAYSIASYAYAVQETAANWPESLLSVTKLMMLYGDAATAYFTNPH